MKKIIFLTLIAVILSNCDISVRKANAEKTGTNISCNDYDCITYDKVTIEGMEFAVFSSTHPNGMAPFVINLTKEKLEIELLKKQLK